MSDAPFGFGPADRSPEERPDQPDDPLSTFPLFAELQKLLSWQGGPVNWDLARQLAGAQLAGSQQPVQASARQEVTAAVQLADLWLNEITTLPSGVASVEAWTRLEWVDRTLPVWSALCDPVASRVVAAMGTAIPAEAGPQAGQLIGVLNSIGGLMFGAQVGQALAGLATEVLSATEIGLPLGPVGVAALVPENVAAFGAGLGRPAEEVRLYLALREAAHQRLFGHVPWLRQRLLDTVDAYARGITVDTSAIERAVSELDPTNPESLQEALAGGLFEPQTTPEQKTALARLETLLALVEGWVDAVVAQAAGSRLPGAEALRETLRRRRASGGPAEQTFATLVGLTLRPRRLREAARLWQVLAEQRGVEGRDAVWAHPDLLPAADDLDDPDGFAKRSETGADDFPELDGPTEPTDPTGPTDRPG
jgi:putative hydrolase